MDTFCLHTRMWNKDKVMWSYETSILFLWELKKH